MSQRLLAHHADPQLARLVQGLHAALAPLASTVAEIQHGADWLARISAILDPAPTPQSSATEVAQHLHAWLGVFPQQNATERQ